MAAKKDTGDAAKGDVADQIAAEQAQGFVGVSVDPEPNEAYALTSGPDSPGQLPDDRTRRAQPEAKP